VVKNIVSGLLIVVLFIALLFAGYQYYQLSNRYRAAQGVISVYIDLYGRVSGGLSDAQQLVLKLGERNKLITKAAIDGLRIIKEKWGVE